MDGIGGVLLAPPKMCVATFFLGDLSGRVFSCGGLALLPGSALFCGWPKPSVNLQHSPNFSKYEEIQQKHYKNAVISK